MPTQAAVPAAAATSRFTASVSSVRMSMSTPKSTARSTVSAPPRFGAAGGEGSLQTQRLALTEAGEELERLHEQARRKREEQGRLYASLGGLGGLALALMLL